MISRIRKAGNMLRSSIHVAKVKHEILKLNSGAGTWVVLGTRIRDSNIASLDDIVRHGRTLSDEFLQKGDEVKAYGILQFIAYARIVDLYGVPEREDAILGLLVKYLTYCQKRILDSRYAISLEEIDEYFFLVDQVDPSLHLTMGFKGEIGERLYQRHNLVSPNDESILSKAFEYLNYSFRFKLSRGEECGWTAILMVDSLLHLRSPDKDSNIDYGIGILSQILGEEGVLNNPVSHATILFRLGQLTEEQARAQGEPYDEGELEYFEEALLLLLEGVAINEQNGYEYERILSLVYEALGNAYLKRNQGYTDKNEATAIDYFEKALALKADSEGTTFDSIRIRFNIAHFYLFSQTYRDIAKALEYAEVAYEQIKPWDVGTHKIKGIRVYAILLYLNDSRRSGESFEIIHTELLESFETIEKGDVLQLVTDLVSINASSKSLSTDDLLRSLSDKGIVLPTSKWEGAHLQACLGRSYAGEGLPEKAVQCYRESLNVFEPEVAGEISMILAEELGDILVKCEQFEEAETAYTIAAKSADIQHERFILTGSKYQLLRDVPNIYFKLAFLKTRKNQTAEAVLLVEKARNRTINSTLQSTCVRLETLRKENAELFDEYSNLERIVSSNTALQLEGMANFETMAIDKMDEIDRVLADYAGVIEKIRAIEGYEELFGQLQWADVQNRLHQYNITNEHGDGSCFVYLVPTEFCTLLIVLKSKGRELTDVHTHLAPALNSDMLYTSVSRYRGDIPSYPLHLFAESPDSPALIEEALDVLGKLLLTPLLELLPACHEVVLCPVGFLTWHALHCAPVETVDAKIQGIIDRYSVAFAPSIMSLSSQKSKINTDSMVLAVADSSLTEPLPFAGVESKLISQLFSKRSLLVQGDATVPSFWDAILTSNCVHMACHSKYGFDHFLNSSIQLHDGSIELLELLKENRVQHLKLVVLSSCESGVADINNPNESVSLSTAFRLGGAGAVVSSLWPVDDLATMIMFLVFYYELSRNASSKKACSTSVDSIVNYYQNLVAGFEQNCSPVDALKSAQVKLRDLDAKEVLSFVELISTEIAESSIEIQADLNQMKDNCVADLSAKPFASRFYWAGFYILGK